MQDGEIWTFSVRTFDSSQPERTINVNYDGFAEGCYLKFSLSLKVLSMIVYVNVLLVQ